MTGCTIKFEHFFVFLTAVMVLWLCQCILLDDCPDLFGAKSKPPNTELGLPGPNAISYLYIVGVEGVGHHGVGPAMANIAKACKRTVMYEYDPLRRCQKTKKPVVYYMKKLRRLYSTTRQVQVIEDSSFPAGPNCRNSSAKQKKNYNPYNLEWIYDQLHQDGGVSIKFLYLTRDFYRTVASHPEYDGDFATHAKVLNDFVWYIHSEYKIINKKERYLWRQVSYEWFTELRDCDKLVTSLAQFLGWQNCDIARACNSLNETIRQPRLMEVNATELAWAMTYNVSLSIPYLDYVP